MKGLLIKDFKLLKGQKNFFMAITAISIIMIIVSPGTSFPIGFLGFVGALFSLSSISYDEFDNGNAFLFSLPITRKDYVLEKYIFGLISGIMFLLLGTVISLVAIGITKTGSFNEIFLTAGSLFPTILLILSIMLPFILKFGGEKGRIAIIGVMGFIFVIGLLLIKTTEYLGIDLYVLINKLPKFEPLVYIILFLLLSVVILGISYLISLTIEKRGVLMDLTILVVGLILGVGIPLRNKAIKKRRENMKEKGNEEK